MEAHKMATIVATFRQGGKWPVVKTATIVAIRWTVDGTTVLTSRSGNEGYNCTHGRVKATRGLVLVARLAASWRGAATMASR